MTHTEYQSNRGGHAPGELRSAFEDYIETGELPDDASWRGRRLTRGILRGALWNCNDTMPRSLCGDLNIPAGSTYAQAVRTAIS